jgi:hypothetical protein
MNRWRVGEDGGCKEMDRCPLTDPANLTEGVIVVQLQDEHLSDHLNGG